jgi:hypothetical protein
MSRCRFALPVLLAAAVAVNADPAKPPLGDTEYASALTAIRPAPGEDRFAQIPWHTSLWEARQAAAKEGKPILLWEMDGHPLGCG